MGAAVRIASDQSDRDAIYRFRYLIYCEQQGLLTEVADHEQRMLSDDDDARSTLFAAWDDGEVVGTVRITGAWDGTSDALTETLQLDRFTSVADPAVIAVLGRFLVHADHRGGSASVLLIFEAAQYCFARRVEIAIGDCEPHLLSYYRSLGFRPYGRIFSHATSLLVPLVLLLGDMAHLRSVGSPIVDMIPADYCDAPSDAVRAILEEAGASDLSGTEGRKGIEEVLQANRQRPGILDDLTEEERDLLLSDSFVLSFNEGDLLIGEGLATRTLYAVLSGVVEAHVGDRLMSVCSPGSVVGEVAMFLDTKRTATVTAVSDGKALALSDRVIASLMETDPHLAAKVLWNLGRCMAARLHGAYQ